MKTSFIFGAALLLCVPCAAVTPVQKVLELMNGMLEKGKKEKHEEAVQFSAYSQWCADTTAEKKNAIAAANDHIEKCTTDIAKYTSDIATLTKDMKQLDADMSTWRGNMGAATKQRGNEKKDYDALHKDLSESIDALERAIQVLREQAHDRKQAPGSSLMQISALKQLKLVPASAKTAIDAFLQGQDTLGLMSDAPEAAGYEFQSHGVIEMLDKLLDKFVNERTRVQTEESNAKHSYTMMMQDLTAQTTQAEQDHAEKTTFKATAIQNMADTEADRKDTVDLRDSDDKFLKDMTATCTQKASDFESRQQLRADEIEAIEKAIEIMSSSSVSGNAEKHLPTMIQASALAQLRSESHNQVQETVAQYLRDQGKQLNSRVLAAMAEHVMADPFAKVKKMIKDLLIRLMEEANQEAEHKGWCDTELSTNEQLRNEKTESVEMLHAEIDELTASISKLNEEMTDLTQAIASLDASMAKQTDLRQKEKATNAETIADAQEAQVAVAQALTVLKDFYEKAADATSFTQQQPEIFDKPYKGMQSENGGVVGMLEVIQSDFSRLEADTTAAETTAQKEYDEFMTSAKTDRAEKSTDLEHKTNKKAEQEVKLSNKKDDLDGTQKELDAALAYYDKLKPTCVDASVSYGDRVSRRKEEIQSLQEALRILNGEDLA